MYKYFASTLGYAGLDAVEVVVIITADEQGVHSGDEIVLGNTFAMSSDVINHEFVHEVVDVLYDPKYELGRESAALEEAVADFFPADKTGDPRLTAPTAVHGSSVTVIRDISETTNLPEYLLPDPNDPELDVSIYEYGKLLSGALWQLRGPIPSVSAILLTALQISPDVKTFLDVRRYISTLARSPGQPTDIEAAFVSRKIGGPLRPTDIIIKPTDSKNVKIVWDDNSALEAGYDVERDLGSGSWSTIIFNLPADTEQYIDNDVQCNDDTNDVASYRIVVFETYTSGAVRRTETVTAPIDFSLQNCESLSLHQSPRAMLGYHTQPDTRNFVTQLAGAHPNPFNPSTSITFSLANAGRVRLTVYNVLGRRVAVLMDDQLDRGEHDVRFEAADLPSGMYIVRMETQGLRFTSRILLMK